MIIQTTRIGRAGGVHYLAAHLLDKTKENEKIEVLAGDRAALHDAQALAEVKRCRYSVRHLSISPEREMTPAQLAEFVRAIDAEFGIGPDRPRLVVRHTKNGRSHFHVAVAEVDPVSLRVLDCRQDFARLEDIARRYETVHGEHVQPSRAERRAANVEGFSDFARKRAERTSPGFDRTRLKTAFAKGAAAFLAELKTQGLRLADGEKGAVVENVAGVFVAAANRAAGVRKNEFQKFMEGMRDDRLIGSQNRASGHAGEGRTQHCEAPAASKSARNAGRPGQDRATDGSVAPHPRSPAATGDRVEDRRRQGGPSLPALIHRRRREELFLHGLVKVDLDDLLRRARDLAAWIISAFEPETSRLARHIEEARKRKSFPHPPAEAARPPEPTYDFRRRTTP